MTGMEVEFTYKITGASPQQWAALETACERAHRLNRNLAGYTLSPPQEDEESGQAVFLSTGHDQSAIKRKIVAPIRILFLKAGIVVDKIQLTGTRVLPTGRSLTLEQGRTPKNTFTDPNLGQMLADHGATLKPSSPGGA